MNIHEYQAKELLRSLPRADAPGRGRLHVARRRRAWPRSSAAAAGS